MISLVLLLAVLSLSYLWVKRRFNFWRDKGFQQAEGSFPFGSMKGLGSEITFAECLDQHYQRFKGKGPAVGFYSFLTPQIFVSEPELVKDVLVKEFQYFHDRGLYHNKKDDPMGSK
jgi:cytochrome P450 family 6